MLNKKNGILLLLVLALLAQMACNTTPETPPAEIESSGNPAIDQLSRLIAEKSDDYTLYSQRYALYMENAMFAKAIGDAEQMMDLDSTSVETYKALANAYFENLQSKSAIKTLEKAIDKFPEEEYLSLMLGEMQLVVEQYNDALITVDKLLKKNPYNVDALFMRGQVFKYMGDTIQAMTNYQQATEIDADFVDAYLQLGILSDGMGSHLAVQYFKNALTIDSTNKTALMSLAWHYHRQFKFDKAEEWYNKAVIQHPSDHEIQYNMGNMFIDKADKTKSEEDLRKALKYFDNATELDPTFAEAYFNRGYCKERLGDKQGAAGDYTQTMVFKGLLEGVSVEVVEAALKRVTE